MTLKEAWQKRLETIAEGEQLIAEGRTVRAIDNGFLRMVLTQNCAMQ